MARARAFKQIDVFTKIPLLGNPVAVVLDGAGLSDAEMQRFANWTNLSETTFVIPPTQEGADYAVRIWTPMCELPFAGHPTLGTAYAMLEAGLVQAQDGKLVQECAVGLVEISAAEDWRTTGLSFRLPRYAQMRAPQCEDVVAAIGDAVWIVGQPAVVDVGPHWVIAELVSAEILAGLKPDLAALAAYNRRTETTGLTVFAQDGDGLVVRSFAPTDGLAEDPVCGSGNAAVAAYRIHAGTIGDGTTYVARQGAAMGRDGFVHVRIDRADIHVGGACVTCIEGQVSL